MDSATLSDADEGLRSRQVDQAQTGEPPSLIILCSWADAPRRAVVKYTRQYEELFPSAQLVLIESSFRDIITRSEAHQRKVLAPVVQQVSALDRPRVVAHIFSNGGSYMLTQLAKVYQETCHAQLPLQALVLDSCPGGAKIGTNIRAISTALPRQWYMYYPGLVCVCAFILLYSLLAGRDNVIERIRQALNDPTYISLRAPRLYVFSKKDEMVSWQAVSAHVEHARARGYVVLAAEFRGSKHVAHAVKDPQRYWELVSETLVCSDNFSRLQ